MGKRKSRSLFLDALVIAFILGVFWVGREVASELGPGFVMLTE